MLSQAAFPCCFQSKSGRRGLTLTRPSAKRGKKGGTCKILAKNFLKDTEPKINLQVFWSVTLNPGSGIPPPHHRMLNLACERSSTDIVASLFLLGKPNLDWCWNQDGMNELSVEHAADYHHEYICVDMKPQIFVQALSRMLQDIMYMALQAPQPPCSAGLLQADNKAELKATILVLSSPLPVCCEFGTPDTKGETGVSLNRSC